MGLELLLLVLVLVLVLAGFGDLEAPHELLDLELIARDRLGRLLGLEDLKDGGRGRLEGPIAGGCRFRLIISVNSAPNFIG